MLLRALCIELKDSFIRYYREDKLRAHLSALSGLNPSNIFDFHMDLLYWLLGDMYSVGELKGTVEVFEKLCKGLGTVSGDLIGKDYVTHPKLTVNAIKDKLKSSELKNLLKTSSTHLTTLYRLATLLDEILGPNHFTNLMLCVNVLHSLESKDAQDFSSKLESIPIEFVEYFNTKFLKDISKNFEYFISVLQSSYQFRYPVSSRIQSCGHCTTLDDHLTVTNCKLLDHNCDTFCPLKLCRTLITIVPMLFPQLLYLDHQCQRFWSSHPVRPSKSHGTLFSDRTALSTLMDTFGYQEKDLQAYIGIDALWTGRHMNLFLKDLDLLKGSNTSTTMPFNSNAPLYKLYTCCVTYFQQRGLKDNVSKCVPKVPSTLRDILKVTAFLPFSSQFEELLQHLKSFCASPTLVDYPDLYCVLLVSSSFSALFLQLLERPTKNYLCFYEALFINAECYSLPEDTTMLLHHLSDLCVTLYRGLHFLCLQCSLEPKFGGWRQCQIGKDLEPKVTAVFTDHRCYCDPSQPRRFLPLSGISVTCPLPLQRYLIDDPNYFGTDHNVYHSFRNVCMDAVCQEPLYTHMAKRGWKKENLGKKSATLVSCHNPHSAALTGYDIFSFLKSLVGHCGPDPLLKLTRYLVHITLRPPDSISSYMAFLSSYSQGMGLSDSKDNGLCSALRKEISMFPGRFDASCYTDALKKITECDPKHTDPSFCNTLCCLSQSPGFLMPLDSEVFNLFDSRYSRHYLTWTVHFAKRLWRGLEELKKDFGSHLPNCTVPSSSCIVTCSFALPYLHSSGFHYRDAKQLCERNVTCSKLVTCLDGALRPFTPQAPADASVFYQFLTQVDRFLWSIRHPFACTMLAFWILNIAYLCYVHLWRLDLLHLLSHGLRNRHSFMVSPLVIFAVPTATDVVSYVSY